MVQKREVYSEDKVCGRYITLKKRAGDIDGGLRTKGIFKKDDDQYPLITYITVVYNRVETIKKCMDSVMSQKYPNIEYIIIDGKSTDGTLQLIEKESERIDYYVSQEDDGIYNAMNKGIALARGRFLCFMNSDDECTPDAAQKAIDAYKLSGADIICGIRNLYVAGKKTEEYTYPRFCIKHSVFRYIQMYHQATYASYKVFDNIGGFNEKYSLLADWIWESTAIDSDASVFFCNELLTNFNYDGASFKGIEKRDNEWIEWAMKSFPGLSKEDAELFVYSIDRERHPMFRIDTLWDIAQKYKENLVFQKAFYEDVLLACLETNYDLEKNVRTSNCRYIGLMKKYSISKMTGVFTLNDLTKWLEKQLMDSIAMYGVDLFDQKKQVLDKLITIRAFQIALQLKIYRRECYYITHPRYCIRAITKYCYYMKGKKAGRSPERSRKFYLEARTGWALE